MKSAEYIGQLFSLLVGDILPTLPAHNQAVLNQLAYKFANSEGDSFQYDSETLSEKANLSLITLRRAIQNLESLGFLEILEKGSSHKPTRYRLKLPRPAESGQTESGQLATRRRVHSVENVLLQKHAEYTPVKAFPAAGIAQKLSFPYNWANSNMSDEALIASVLRKNRLQDVMHICAQYGIDKVSEIAAGLKDPVIRDEAEQTLNRIRIGKEMVHEEIKP